MLNQPPLARFAVFLPLLRRGRSVTLALLLTAAAPALFDPATGYRVAQYRAPVPETPPGVSRVTPAEAAALARRSQAVFLDLMPAEGGSRGPDGRWRLAAARLTIPHAHWFPQAGVGDPDPATLAEFHAGVAKLTRGDRRRTVVTFCLADCWRSWNAALRLHRAGYRDVRWLMEGTDGWRDLDLPLVPVRPYGEPMPEPTTAP